MVAMIADSTPSFPLSGKPNADFRAAAERYSSAVGGLQITRFWLPAHRGAPYRLVDQAHHAAGASPRLTDSVAQRLATTAQWLLPKSGRNDLSGCLAEG